MLHFFSFFSSRAFFKELNLFNQPPKLNPRSLSVPSLLPGREEGRKEESVAAQGSSLEGAEMGSSCRCRWGLLWLESFQTPYQPIRPQKELWLGRPSRYSAGYPPSLISSPTSFVESDDGVGEEAMGWDGGRFYVQNHSLSVCGDSRWWFFIKTFRLILSFL